MKTKFGINSAISINKKLKNGYTMYDWVMRQKGFPSFCMRTLCGEEDLTAEEIEFLKTKNCKIGLVVRDLTEKEVSSVNGTESALKSIKKAKELGVPKNNGIAIFAEIKPDWSINHNWMISFAHVILTNGYVPGFIANTDSSKNFNFDRQCSHYVQATKDDNYLGAIFAATEPKLDNMPEEWNPYCPSELESKDISLWICGSTKFNSIYVEDVYAIDEKILAKM